MSDNLRQSEPSERAALAHLRHGNVAVAVGWYARAGRVHPVAGRGRAVNAMVKAWAKDTGAGRETLMLAYRRDNVEALNQTARRLWEQAGLLSGPELTAPGGRRYRAGDRIITLAPGPRGAWVTSQAAHVTAVDPQRQQLTAVTPDGQQLTMGPDDIGAERLGHGYAITAHRSQGSTVDVAHVLDDGGGRELAYVAMSRARTASHIYVTALDPDHAAQRLTWGWDQQRRQQWITHRHHLARARTAELIAERDRLAASIPPDVTDQLTRLRHQIAHIEADRADLHAGTGRWANTPVGHARQALQDAQRTHGHDLVRAHDPYLGLWARHRARKAEQASAIALTQAETDWQETIQPYDDRPRPASRTARPRRTKARGRPTDPHRLPRRPPRHCRPHQRTRPRHHPTTNDSGPANPTTHPVAPGLPSSLARVTTPTSNTSTTSKSPKPSTLHRSAAPESDSAEWPATVGHGEVSGPSAAFHETSEPVSRRPSWKLASAVPVDGRRASGASRGRTPRIVRPWAGGWRCRRRGGSCLRGGRSRQGPRRVRSRLGGPGSSPFRQRVTMWRRRRRGLAIQPAWAGSRSCVTPASTCPLSANHSAPNSTAELKVPTAAARHTPSQTHTGTARRLPATSSSAAMASTGPAGRGRAIQ